MSGHILDPIAVVGAGAWGTALANAAAETGRSVLLWGRDAQAMARMAEVRENAPALPGVTLRDGVRPVSSLTELRAARMVLLSVPAQVQGQMAEALALVLAPRIPVVTCAKGIDARSGAFMTEILAEALPHAIPAVLSGPSFAADVARGLPTAVTLAAPDEVIAAALAQALSTSSFRVYHTTDMRGVEIGGAGKNVLAIAAGIVAGRGLGESAKAAIIARGFAELGRFARAFGARPETLMGLSGLGDLVLSATSPQSRNYAFGLALGRGASVAEAAGGKLAEGAFTAPVLVRQAEARGIDMPVSMAVDAVVAGRTSIEDTIAALMARPVRAEHEEGLR